MNIKAAGTKNFNSAASRGSPWWLMCLALLLTSCGFHLRGAYQLPEQMKTTFVQAEDNNSELLRILKRDLTANNIRLVENEQQAQAILRIGGESRNRRVIAVDTRGRAREYALSYQVSFSMVAHDPELRVEQQNLSLQRDFLFDPEDVLGKSREEATLIRDMQQEMVRRILLRLQAAGSNANPETSSPVQ